MTKTYGISSDLSGRISALKSRKEKLENRITEELKRPYPSNDLLTPLKQDKLHIKEEITNLTQHGL